MLHRPNRTCLALLVASLTIGPRWGFAGPSTVECPHVALTSEAPEPNRLLCLQAFADGRGAWAAWLRAGPETRLEMMRLDPLGGCAWRTPREVSESHTPWVTRFSSASDSAGGMLIAWLEQPRPVSRDRGRIVVQRVDALGHPRWGGGIVASRLPGLSTPTLVASDGGGAIVTWLAAPQMDSRVAVQRLDARGHRMWRNELLTAYNAEQASPVGASDDSGGAVVLWVERAPSPPLPPGFRANPICGNERPRDTTPGPWLHAQRIDVSGRARWGDGGIVLSDSGAQASEPVAMETPDGRVHVVWHQELVGKGMHVGCLDTRTGRVLWQKAFTGANATDWGFQQLAPADSGGVLLGWTSGVPNGNERTLWVQRLDVAGRPRWGELGVDLGTGEHHFEPVLLSDGAGGAYVGSVGRVRAYHVNATGLPTWPAAGVSVCAGVDLTTDMVLIPRVEGGVTALWLKRGLVDEWMLTGFDPMGNYASVEPH